MNIEEQLKDIHSQSKTLKDIRNLLEEEKIQLEKNMYLLDVIQITQYIKEFSNTSFFSKNNIHELRIWSFEEDQRIRLQFACKDSSGEEVYRSEHDLLEKIVLLSKEMKISNHFVSEEIKGQVLTELFLVIDEKIEDKMLEVLLSKELLSLYNYTKIDSVLENTKEHKNQRKKV